MFWLPPLEAELKSNIYWTARGKPGLVGIEKVLPNNLGVVFAMFLKPVGTTKPNEMEVLAIIETLRIFSSSFCGKLGVKRNFLNAMLYLECLLPPRCLGDLTFMSMKSSHCLLRWAFPFNVYMRGLRGKKIFRFDGYYYIIVFFSRVLLLVFGGVLYLLVLAVGDGFGCMALFVSLFLSNIFLLLPAKNKNTTVRNFLSLAK